MLLTSRTRYKSTSRSSSLIHQIEQIDYRANGEIVPPHALSSTPSRIGLLARIKTKLQFDTVRQQQIEELATTDRAVEISESERDAHRELIASSTALTLVTVGAVAYAPIASLSIVPLSFVIYLRGKLVYRKAIVKRRMSIAVVDALWHVGAVLTGNYFWAAFSGIIYSIGSKLLSMTEDSTRKNLTNILGEQPQSVWIWVDGAEVEIPFEQLQIDDVIIVSAGQMIPVDGTIISGAASIDQHALTGESQPAEKGAGDGVLASTVLLSGKLKIRVDKTGLDTAAGKVGSVLLETSNFQLSMKTRGEAITDRAAIPTLLISGASLPYVGGIGSLALLGNYPGGILRTLSPTTLLVFLQMASRNGILIKDGRSIELMSKVDAVVFDKTGTLTLETPHVGAIHTCGHYAENELLQFAATAERRQPHPIARAILNTASERGITLSEFHDAQYEIGYGIQVRQNETLIHVGSSRFMDMEGIDIPPAIETVHTTCKIQGHALVMVAVDHVLVGAIELHATIRPETKAVVDQLRERNLPLYIISGDQEEPTKKLANELGIDNYFANTLPENKAKLVEQLQAEGKTVCFIGDGINDSIALGQADVSISLAGSSTIATDAAQIVLMDAHLQRLIDLLDLTHELEKSINRSIVISAVPSVVGLGGVFFLGMGLGASCLLYTAGKFVGAFNVLQPLTNKRWNGNKREDS